LKDGDDENPYPGQGLSSALCCLCVWFVSTGIQTRSVTMKFPEWFYCATLREPCDLIVVKTCLRMFQLVKITISAH